MSEPKKWTDPELVLDQWYKYEQIAMHFNDLIMKFRTQSLGGLATLSTLTAFATAKGLAVSFVPYFMFFILVLWLAAWVLDSLYYSKLLVGAVQEIERLEALYTEENGTSRIQLSSTIENVTRGWPMSVNAFYLLVFTGLVLVFGLTYAGIHPVTAIDPNVVP